MKVDIASSDGNSTVHKSKKSHYASQIFWSLKLLLLQHLSCKLAYNYSVTAVCASTMTVKE